VPGLRRLRRFAHKPLLADAPETGVKPLRDCSDEEVEAIARYYSQEHASLWDYDECLSFMMETREHERQRLESGGFFRLLALVWTRHLHRAARRSLLARWLLSTFPLTARFYVKWRS
jgi:hypothetical protein